MSGPSNISAEFSSVGGNYKASEQAESFTSKTRHKQRSSNRSTIQNGSNQVEGAPESKLSLMSRKVNIPLANACWQVCGPYTLGRTSWSSDLRC